MFKYGDIGFTAIEEEHLKILFKMRTDEEINNMLFSLYPISMYGQKKWLDNLNSDNSRKVFMVNYHHSTIGCIRLEHIDFVNRRVEVGADILEEYRGQGFGKQLYNALLQYCFDYLGMHQVYLYCLEINDRAIKCYEKVGFEKVCVLKDWIWKHGKWQNVVMMNKIKG